MAALAVVLISVGVCAGALAVALVLVGARSVPEHRHPSSGVPLPSSRTAIVQQGGQVGWFDTVDPANDGDGFYDWSGSRR